MRWDPVAKIEGKPLCSVLAERDNQGAMQDKVQCNRTVSFSSRARLTPSASRRERSSVFPRGGNQMTLHIVGGLGLGGCDAYPDVFDAFAGFADDAKVDNGWLKRPDRPGIGFEAQSELYALMRQLARFISKKGLTPT